MPTAWKMAGIPFREAVPQQLVPPPYMGNQLMFLQALWTISGTLAAADTVELIRIPSSYRYWGVWLKHESAMGTTVTSDVGIGIPRGVGLAPIPVAAASVVSALTGAAARPRLTNVGGPAATAKGSPMWTVAGAAADPNLEYVIYMTASSVTAPTNGVNVVFHFLVSAP